VRKLLAILFLLATAATLSAQTGISGYVLKAVDQKPVIFAKVGAYPHGAMTHANKVGYYFLSLRPGTYKVGASADSFVHATYPESVVVIEGRVTEHIDFALVYSGTPPPKKARVGEAERPGVDWLRAVAGLGLFMRPEQR